MRIMVKDAVLNGRIRASAACRSSSKAQISVETLLVFLVFLIILGIAYTASTKLGAASQQGIGKALSRETFNELSSKIEEACLLGNGNVRIVRVKGQAVSLSSSGRTLQFTAPEFSGQKDFSCEISSAPESASTVFTIKNENGIIRIS
jgi:uncharacterized protein (UPF0333 family)